MLSDDERYIPLTKYEDDHSIDVDSNQSNNGDNNESQHIVTGPPQEASETAKLLLQRSSRCKKPPPHLLLCDIDIKCWGIISPWSRDLSNEPRSRPFYGLRAQVVKMVRMNPLADALNTIEKAGRKGKRQVMVRPCSKVTCKFLMVMMKHGYIDEFEMVDDHRNGKIVVNLNGRLNKCGVISPRFDIRLSELEKWTNNLLPSRQFGFLVLTTSGGILDHEESRRKHLASPSVAEKRNEKKGGKNKLRPRRRSSEVVLLVLARKERDLLEIKFEVETEAFCKNQAITIVDSELFMTQHTQEPISMINCEEKNPTEENSAQCLPLLLDDLFSPSMVDDFFHEIEDTNGLFNTGPDLMSDMNSTADSFSWDLENLLIPENINTLFALSEEASVQKQSTQAENIIHNESIELQQQQQQLVSLSENMTAIIDSISADIKMSTTPQEQLPISNDSKSVQSLQQSATSSFSDNVSVVEKYHERRQRNNLASRKSREKRKKNNHSILLEIEELSSTNEKLKTKIKTLEENLEKVKGELFASIVAKKSA
ncbi:RP-S15Ae [Acanthosepion pharaonis]|uniref:RP-S15Ae n=1 Tax=Acanthosepion pharaonis TaxID=158019 RepID=A0A812AQN7_ACAPH|nr:RP-S15Ae [Sepia pharaonis]